MCYNTLKEASKRVVTGMENGRDYDETYDADYDLESDFDEIPAAELDADQAILSVPVPPPEPLPENEAEETRQKLKRELREEALSRMEASARTEQDFREVVSTWDHLDKNRERKERSHELLRGSIPLEYKLKNTYDALVFPEWKGAPLERQLAHGNFLDFLADCPYEMHNLTAKAYIWKAVRDMKDEHRAAVLHGAEILFAAEDGGFSRTDRPQYPQSAGCDVPEAAKETVSRTPAPSRISSFSSCCNFFNAFCFFLSRINLSYK